HRGFKAHARTEPDSAISRTRFRSFSEAKLTILVQRTNQDQPGDPGSGDGVANRVRGAGTSSAAGELDLVALRGQAGSDLLAMVPLDLDRAVLRGAAGAAVALQVRRDSVEVARREAADDGHRLAAALSLVTEDPDNAV